MEVRFHRVCESMGDAYIEEKSDKENTDVIHASSSPGRRVGEIASRIEYNIILEVLRRLNSL